jgi:hypothetical protein
MLSVLGTIPSTAAKVYRDSTPRWIESGPHDRLAWIHLSTAKWVYTPTRDVPSSAQKPDSAVPRLDQYTSIIISSDLVSWMKEGVGTCIHTHYLLSDVRRYDRDYTSWPNSKPWGMSVGSVYPILPSSLKKKECRSSWDSKKNIQQRVFASGHPPDY